MIKWRLIFFVLLVASCKIVVINDSGYHSMTTEEKEMLRPYSSSLQNESFMKDNFIYEVKKRDIDHICALEGKILLKFWVPSCSGSFNDFIHEYIRLAKKNGLNIFLISRDYDLKSVQEINNQYPIDAKVYVLDYDDFGSDDKERLEVYKNHLESISGYSFEDFPGEVLFENKKVLAVNDEVVGFLKY